MASTSTVSLQKQDYRRASCDTNCSTNSSCFLQKRKAVHPLATSVRAIGTKNVGNVKQRVFSARLLKLRSLQNQLNDLNYHLAELTQENRALKTLQKRQDQALKRYEGTNADLPRLIQSHEEEIRVLQVKNKTLRKTLKEASDLLKVKEDELTNVRHQLKQLNALVKDKNLAERQKLSEQVEELTEKLNDSEQQIALLNRKVMLETKNCKHKLNVETSKFKKSQRELMTAIGEIDRLTAILEGKDKPTNNKKRFSGMSNSVSAVSLGSNCRDSCLQTADSEISLEQVIALEDKYNINKLKEKSKATLPGILTSPNENIKVRLSGSLHKDTTQETEKDSVTKADVPENIFDDVRVIKSVYTNSSSQIYQKNRPNSSQKLEKLSAALQSKIESNNNVTEDVRHLDECCSEVLTSVETITKTTDKHKELFENAQTETKQLLKSLKETDELESKIRHNKVLMQGDLEIPEHDLDLVNQIWNEQYSFQTNFGSSKESIKNNSLSKACESQEPAKQEDKKKLLATLRAIDNGEDVGLFDHSSRKTKLMQALFGDTHK